MQLALLDGVVLPIRADTSSGQSNQVEVEATIELIIDNDDDNMRGRSFRAGTDDYRPGRLCQSLGKLSSPPKDPRTPSGQYSRAHDVHRGSASGSPNAKKESAAAHSTSPSPSSKPQGLKRAASRPLEDLPPVSDIAPAKRRKVTSYDWMGSPTVDLVVGQNLAMITVHTNILEGCPGLIKQVDLTASPKIGNSLTSINLPNEDEDVMKKLVHYLYFGACYPKWSDKEKKILDVDLVVKEAHNPSREENFSADIHYPSKARGKLGEYETTNKTHELFRVDLQLFVVAHKYGVVQLKEDLLGKLNGPYPILAKEALLLLQTIQDVSTPAPVELVPLALMACTVHLERLEWFESFRELKKCVQSPASLLIREAANVRGYEDQGIYDERMHLQERGEKGMLAVAIEDVEATKIVDGKKRLVWKCPRNSLISLTLAPASKSTWTGMVWTHEEGEFRADAVVKVSWPRIA
ncbi:MAG: hypothetical protein M1833_003876 [Piccolia ochrophora]|nr:MAG: hypothetical protein M1833_003876 [Piccolia ochrophora]